LLFVGLQNINRNFKMEDVVRVIRGEQIRSIIIDGMEYVFDGNVQKEGNNQRT